MAAPPSFSLVPLGAPDPALRTALERQPYPHWALAEADGPARGDFILFLPPGVGIAKSALLWLALAIGTGPEAEMFYADEDRIGSDGSPHSPDFKPVWDPDLALARDLIGPTGAYRRDLAERIGFPRARSLAAFALQAARQARGIRHVPKILFHQVGDGPDSDSCADRRGARAARGGRPAGRGCDGPGACGRGPGG